MNKYGLIGAHLSHSFSPKLHNIIFKHSDIVGEYNLFEMKRKDLKSLIEKLKTQEIKGFNITIPYKVEILKYLDQLSAEAEMIDAVNTLEFKDDKIIGHNTDYYGFGALLGREKIDIKSKKILILGTGGASKSVFYYLNNNGGKEILLASRDPNSTKTIYPNSNVMDYKEIKNLNAMDIIINTTPVGMYPSRDKSPVDNFVLSKFNTAIDLIYNPLESKFLKTGREEGLKTANGLYMLVAQGIKSQEIWNKREFSDDFYNIVYNEVLKYVE